VMDNATHSAMLFPSTSLDTHQNNLSQAARAVAAAINKLLCSINLELGESDSDSGEEEELPNDLLFRAKPHRITFSNRLDVLNR